MKIVKRGKELWITDCRPDIGGDMGPYDDRADAESDMKGVAKSNKVLEKMEAQEAAAAAKKAAKAKP